MPLWRSGSFGKARSWFTSCAPPRRRRTPLGSRCWKSGLYGRVSVEAWTQPGLPYVDNLVSLLVVLDPGKVGREELLRVLRPDGEMLVKQGERFVSTVKPRIAGTDEWTHWRHGPDRNAVSQDKLVDVPRRVQWLFTSAAVGERSHVLLTKGRAFAQDRETLIARDAFNGLPLWKAKLQKGNAFDWEYAVKVAALIVAKDERVYALTDDGRLKALDAATGKPVMVYENAGVPWDILLVEDGRSQLGTLVLAGQDSIRALDAETGRLLWQEPCDWPHNTITSTDTVFYIVGSDRRGKMEGEIIARELLTGRLLWRKTYYWARRTDLGAFGYDRLFYEMRSPHNWRDFYEKHPEEKEQDRYGLVIIDAKTGEELQKLKVGSSARHGEFRTGFWRHGQLVTEAFAKEGLSIAIYDLDRWERTRLALPRQRRGRPRLRPLLSAGVDGSVVYQRPIEFHGLGYAAIRVQPDHPRRLQHGPLRVSAGQWDDLHLSEALPLFPDARRQRVPGAGR